MPIILYCPTRWLFPAGAISGATATVFGSIASGAAAAAVSIAMSAG